MKKLLLVLFSAVLLLSCSAEEMYNETPKTIVGWGDSMMQGAGGNGDNIISIVARELNISEYYNFGVGGLTSDNVVFLSGGKDFKVKVNDSLKLIEYPTMPFNQNTHQNRVVEIDGVNGELIRENYNFYLRGFESFDEERTIKFKDAEKNKNSLVIIWVGRNDSQYNNTIENIKAMTEGNNAFVLSICNATWDEEGSELYERIENNNFDELDKNRAIELIEGGNGHLVYNENHFKLQKENEKLKNFTSSIFNIFPNTFPISKEASFII